MDAQFNITQQLSVYIPHINPAQATTEYIVDIFHRFNIGFISHIEFKHITNKDEDKDYSYYSAFIFMKYWYNNKMVERLQDKIMNSDGARIVYDDPQYWILYPIKNEPQPSEYLLKIEQKYSDKFYEMGQNISEMGQNISEMGQNISEMRQTLGESQWWNRLHEANIKYIFDKIREEKPVEIDLLGEAKFKSDSEAKFKSHTENITMSIIDNSYINNSCCGAVSDAWKPSSSSIEPNVWFKRLRQRRI